MENLEIDTWSESVWTFLETMIVRYNPDNHVWIEDMTMFFKILPRLLPCQKCGMHLIRYNYHYPLQDSLESQVTFFFWIYNMRRSMGFKYCDTEYAQYMFQKFRKPHELFVKKVGEHQHLRKEFNDTNKSRRNCNCGGTKQQQQQLL